MAGYRLLRLLLHFLSALLASATIFPLFSADQRQRYIQRWSASLLAICGVTVRVSKRHEIAPNALIVANHLSWLDIYLINSVSPSRFIAKASVRNWPLIGWLSEKAGTVFIARGSSRDLRKIFQNLVVHLKTGERFSFFPEGTTAAQGQLLPFHANLFEAAIEAGTPVQPYALRYLNAVGGLHAAIDFSGDTRFLESVFAVLKARHINAELIILPPLETAGAHRRSLALAARQAVALALNQSQACESRDNRPETPRDLPAAPP